VGRPRRNAFDRMRPLRRAVQPFESLQVRVLGRSILSVAFRRPVLVLETLGRRSGRRRRTTLVYGEQGDALFVVGGAGGQAATPDWVANLRAHPAVRVTRDRRTTPMQARELAGEERAATWRHLVQVLPVIETYERRAGRPIPVVRLTAT